MEDWKDSISYLETGLLTQAGNRSSLTQADVLSC